ncbi:MAG: TIGR02444 family protein [Alphaproteobacteria bacterium]
MAQFPPCEFWDFSLAVYGRKGVASACLSLQERHRVDVNLLLFCCWLGASGRGAVAGDGLARVAAAVDGWHGGVVRGLRAVRVLLKGESGGRAGELPAALRKKVAALELEAEHIEQLRLAGLAPPALAAKLVAPPAERARDAARGAAGYLASLGATLDSADRDALQAVLAGVFPELARESLAAAIAANI